MRKPKLSLEPQNVSDDLWYYEERKGVCVVNRRYVKAHEDATTDYLPWRLICASVDRYRAVQRANKRKAVKRAKH